MNDIYYLFYVNEYLIWGSITLLYALLMLHSLTMRPVSILMSGLQMLTFRAIKLEFYLRNPSTAVEKLLRLKGPSVIVRPTSSSHRAQPEQ